MIESSRPRRRAQPAETVVCLGSSTTASRGTYKWIAELEKRPQNRRFRFVNLGVGGDLSFNAISRVDRAVSVRPDRVLILIGTNDILATVFPNLRRLTRVWKRVADDPSPARFTENLALITRRLRRETDARIALSSLAPVGEDPHSANPVQAQLNDLFATYNGAIRATAAGNGLGYVPFAESFQNQLLRAKSAKPFTQLSFPALYRDYLVRELILRRSFDDIARINGWQFHVDGIHLNTNGGSILTDVVQQFLDSETP